MAENYAQNADETSASDNAEPNGDFLCGGPRLVHQPRYNLMRDADNEVVDTMTFPVVGAHEDTETAAPKDFNPGAGNAPARTGGKVFDYSKLDKISGDADGD